MIRTFKTAVAAIVLAVTFAGSVAAGPLEDATAAYVKGDYSTALRLIRPLAEKDDANAQRLLGDMYADERGVPKDMKPDARYAMAATWYRKAAEQGDAAAKSELADIQDRLGIMYELGVGVAKDHAEAAVWYRMAAEQGYADAQVNLGNMYVRGLGVPQDYVTAHMWLNLAAASGNKGAVKERDMLAARMTPAQIAEAQKLAREWKPK
jgi:TPR repeat protein